MSPRSIGFVVVLVAVLAGRASFVDAQSTSGWILWEKYFTTNGSKETTTWEPQDGFALLADCRTSAQQLLQNALTYVKDTGGKLLGPVRPDGRSVVFEVTQSGVQQRIDVRYVCFPGSFDPRTRP